MLDEKKVSLLHFAGGSLMLPRCWRLAWLILALDVFCAHAATTSLAVQKSDVPSPRSVALDQLDPRCRETVRQILEKTTLAGRGPDETFYCRTEQYLWFLDHPDRAVVAWRRLGAKCVSISPRGNGKFGWADETGSEVIWEVIQRGPNVHIWLAEGNVRPSPLLPLVPVKAVVVLRHNSLRAADGAPVMHQQCDLFVHTDSKTAAMMTRMLGPTAHRVAEQGLAQLQLFFSWLSGYLDRHPDQAADLLKSGE